MPRDGPTEDIVNTSIRLESTPRHTDTEDSELSESIISEEELLGLSS